MSEGLTIRHDPRAYRFEVQVDRATAYLAYLELGQQTLDIYRVFVPDALRKRGIAAALTEQALAWAQQMQYQVIPSCSYVERYMQRSAEIEGD